MVCGSCEIVWCVRVRGSARAQGRRKGRVGERERRVREGGQDKTCSSERVVSRRWREKSCCSDSRARSRNLSPCEHAAGASATSHQPSAAHQPYCRALVRPRAHTQTHTRTHARTRARTHARTHTHTPTHTHRHGVAEGFVREGEPSIDAWHARHNLRDVGGCLVQCGERVTFQYHVIWHARHNLHASHANVIRRLF